MSAGANELLITKTDDTTVTISSLTTIASNGADYTGQFAKNLVKKISIGTGITTIKSQAFADCTELTTVTFEGTSDVATMEGGIFSTCSNLTAITIPPSVESVGINIFESCSLLASVTFAGTSQVPSIPDGTFANCSVLNNVIIPASATTIGGAAFRSCGELATLTTHNDITSIGIEAFANCAKLPSITIGNKVTTIGVQAFVGCSLLATVTFTATSTLTTISNNAFMLCVELTGIAIPNSVTSIGDNAFATCSKLASVTLPSGNNSFTTLPDSAFRACGVLTGITIPNSVTTINANTFNACNKLETAIIGTGVTSIAADAFTNAGSTATNTLQAIITSSSQLSTLGLSYGTGKAFFGASNIKIYSQLAKTLIITNTNSGTADEVVTGLTTIASNSYTTTAANIKTISIGPEITQISTNAFQGCTGLTTVNFAITNTLATIQGFAFISCGELTGIAIPNSVTFIGANAFNNCAKLASVSLPSSNSSFTTLSDQVFRSCAKLTSITIPASVTTIGNSVFLDAGLTSVTIPDTVTSLGTSVFNGCTNLDTVVIGSALTSIGATTFNGCTKLRRTTIGDAVASIAADAFTSAGSGLASGTVLQVKMSATPLAALTLSYSVGVAFFGATNVTIVADFVIPAPLPPDASCFPGNTPVQTDQGIVNICDLCPDKHTIRGNKIETITQNTGIENFLILIKKDTLYPNVPSQDTYTTFDHNIFVNKQNIRAGVLETRAQESGIPDLMNRIYQVPYNGEVLYNVLLKDDKHDYMCVNNLIVETMSPKNIFAKYYCYLQNKKQGEENSELEESYKKYSSMTRALAKKHKRSRLTKK